MSNHDYLYTRDMIDSGRTAELTAGERLREKVDLMRDEAKEIEKTDPLVAVSREHGRLQALSQVVDEMRKLGDEPDRTLEQRLLLSVLLVRIQGLVP
jgi:hypothetical protein